MLLLRLSSRACHWIEKQSIIERIVATIRETLRLWRTRHRASGRSTTRGRLVTHTCFCHALGELIDWLRNWARWWIG